LSIRRLWLVTKLDLQESLRHWFFWFWAIFMGFNAWMVSRGQWLVQSNSTSLGGNLSYVNSEFQIAYICAIMGFFVLSFFVAVAAGTPLIRDAENKVGEILHSTPLSPGEYVWGKFLGAFGTTLAALAVFVVTTILFTHGMPNPERPEAYGPFSLRIYVVPVLVILVPAALFIAGAAFALGRISGRLILVFFLPVAGFVFYWFFFWGWRIQDLGPTARFWFQMVDPSGFRWLRQTFLTVDRGISYYNHRPIDWSAAYLLSRLGIATVGLLLVDLARRHFAGRLKTAKTAAPRWRRKAPAEAPATVPTMEPLGVLGMASRKTRGRLAGILAVARFEIKELFFHPPLYILSFLLLLLILGFFENQFENEFQTEIYLTPGVAAAGSLGLLTSSLLLLLLFYTVESLRREPATGASAVIYTTQVRTASLLLGKALANGAVVLMVLLATLVAARGMMIVDQGGVIPMDLAPFVLIWSLLLAPTLILWVSFLLAAYAVTRSQYGTYAVGFAALGLTLWAGATNRMSWPFNWGLFGVLNWTDMGLFPMDRSALVLNRLMALGLAALFLYLAFRLFSRQDRDPLHPLFGRRPGERRRTLLTAMALAVVPLALGFTLWSLVNRGHQGGAVGAHRGEDRRVNHATRLDEPVPYIANVEMDLDLEPAERAFRVNGFYDLRNDHDRPLPWFPVTTGMHWQGLSWTLDGRPVHPEDSHGLQVFRLARPLPPGGTLRLGFRYHARLMPGISRNGGPTRLGEFITPAGGIVTARNPDFVPVVRYLPEIGADPQDPVEGRRRGHQPKTFPPGWYRGVTEAEMDKSSFTHRLRITLPAEYMLTSTGALASNVVKGGRRTVVWVTDYPVRVFNIAFGRWQERRGKNGTVIYYHPEHTYNVDSMLEALDGARQYFPEWFHPYPWRELRLNEFPNLEQYGRGNATNIFFSEGIGFLTQRTPETDAAFWIAAHEAAHSWWGHVVQDGEGPGGVVMSEGTAQFATRLLIEKLRGPQPSIGFAIRDETAYGELRQPSDEKPLAGTYRFRPGDPVVIYNKGAWVMWMLMNHMGRERFFEGTRDYFKTYHNNPDHPVVQDFVAVMRRHVPDTEADTAAYDDFARQWFFGIVIPEYQLAGAKKEQRGEVWEVTVRVKNAGTGRMPVDVAAVAGPRWGEDGRVSPDFKDARVTLVLGAGEEKVARIRCPFEPEAVVVDPDADVMQLQRQAAAARL
jgi:ABC-2 type transport system permease protein